MPISDPTRQVSPPAGVTVPPPLVWAPGRCGGGPGPAGRRGFAGAAAMVVAGLVVATGCGSTPAPDAPNVAATAGTVDVIHPFVPAPANPNVAAF